MGWWQVNADTLAASRFVLSPLSETIGSLFTLRRGTAAHPGERAWLDAHLPAFRRRLADDPVTGLVLAAAQGRRWIADFLTPPPTGAADPDFATELRPVRATPPDLARANLAVSLDRPLPPELDRDDLAERAADLLTWVWTHAVRPDWPRRRRVAEADTVARTARLGQGGWSAVLNDMRPHMRWLGAGRLQINAHDYPPKEISGAELMFVPVTTWTGWVAWAEPSRYAVIYPCAGVLAEADRPPPALGRLLGAARADVLGLLGSPKSTTQLVALTGQGLGSVGRHLRVLYDAGLVDRRRAGHSVLYYRTTAGDVLIGAGGPPHRLPPRGPGTKTA
jgi:DNA-binding transcriptional ArsR family regulator